MGSTFMHEMPPHVSPASDPGRKRLDEAALQQAVEVARAQGIDRDARRVIQWAHELLGEGLMMTTSFQKSGMIILHMVRDIVPELPVFFLDTGFHFSETLEFAERIRREWGINLILQRPKLFGEDFAAKHGKLYERDPDLCCHLNKVEPQKELLERYQGWIAGVRRDQSATRGAADSLEILEGAKLKVQPLSHWSRPEVDAYLKDHEIPTHPLFELGYQSIGCQPCTQPCHDASNERAGRWMGKAKTECGLHTFWKKKEKETERATDPSAQDPSAANPPTVPTTSSQSETMPYPTEFKSVTAIVKANVYFDGKVVSHTILSPDGSKQTLGLIYPGSFRFDTGAPERMAITAGACRAKLPGEAAWKTFAAGTHFDVPGKSAFDIAVDAGICEYICSFLPA